MNPKQFTVLTSGGVQMGSYCVAVTWPLWERRVERTLRQRGLDSYLPRGKTPKPKPRTILLFPRYIFAGPHESWRDVRDVPGISRLLKRGGEDTPAVILESELEALRAREAAAVAIAKLERFKIGARVRIVTGPMAGRTGTYQGRGRRGKECVDTPLGRVELPVGNLLAE